MFVRSIFDALYIETARTISDISSSLFYFEINNFMRRIRVMKWINRASEDKGARICWVYNDKGCGSKKATCVIRY